MKLDRVAQGSGLHGVRPAERLRVPGGPRPGAEHPMVPVIEGVEDEVARTADTLVAAVRSKP